MTLRSKLLSSLMALPVATFLALSTSPLRAQPGPAGTAVAYGTGCGMTLAASAALSIPNGFGGGTNISLLVGGIAPTSIGNHILLDFASIPAPGIDLVIIGAPGCPLLLPAPLLYSSHTGTVPWPTDAFPTRTPQALFWLFDTNWWSGKTVYVQAVSLDPAANAAWVRTSNGLALTG